MQEEKAVSKIKVAVIGCGNIANSLIFRLISKMRKLKSNISATLFPKERKNALRNTAAAKRLSIITIF